VAVGDLECVGGSGDGDLAAVMLPVMERTDQHQVVEFGQPTVLPVHDVMSMQPPGRPAAGDDAGLVAVLEGAA
jgi:hypothetical protein